MRAFIAGAVICLSLTLTACSAPASPSAAPSSPTAAPTSPSTAPASPSVAPTSSLRIEGPGYSYPIDLARARHHLVDIMDVTQTASVAEFQQMARRTIAELRACGVVPILVGGSSLYVRAIVDRFDFPGTDPAVRARWEAELERVGASALHAVLAELSPLAAAAILPGNGRRIVRALEIIEINGVHTPHLPEHRYALEDVLQFGLHIERKLMDERIRLRVDRMWADGLVDEVRSLVAEGLREGVTASRGLGYQQVLEHLAGVLTEEESRQATVDGTRRFARKQLGWFRRDPRIDRRRRGVAAQCQHSRVFLRHLEEPRGQAHSQAVDAPPRDRQAGASGRRFWPHAGAVEDLLL